MGAAASRALALALFCPACTSIAVDMRTFESTHWRIAAIDGRATPRSGDYRMRFEEARITGRFGCSDWSGRYSVADHMLVADFNPSTTNSCPDPAATFEREGLLVLRHPMRWTWSGGRKLTLSNDSGSLTLERQP